MVGWMVGCLVLALGALGLGLGLKNKDGDPMRDASMERSAAAAEVKTKALSLLPDYSLQEIEDDVASPQSLALQYLLTENSHNLLNIYPEWRILQRYALATFFFATKAPDSWFDTTHWLNTDVHECEWYTMYAFSDLADNITYVDSPHPNRFEHNQTRNMTLEDSNNPSMGRWKHLWLCSNRLDGTLPQELLLLTSLRSLSLSSNQLPSRIPSFLGQLPLMTALNLIANGLTGTIPSELGTLTGMNSLLLFNNHLEGTVSQELEDIPELEYLYLDTNSLSGVILPDGLCDNSSEDNVTMWLQFDCTPLLLSSVNDTGPSLCGCNCSCEGV